MQQIVGIKQWLLAGCLLMTTGTLLAQDLSAVRVTRLLDKPIITPDLDERMGTNIQGPSLIRVPDWVNNPLGKYYLYFADHKGDYIRLAYADEVTGPWTVYTPGTLTLAESHFPETCPPCSVPANSATPAYAHIASPDVVVRGDVLYVFWTQVGHAPERILLTAIQLHEDWQQWKELQTVEVLRPEHEWEGADLPLEPSVRGDITVRANQLRDPAIFEENGVVYLLYSVAGESGLAIARVDGLPHH